MSNSNAQQEETPNLNTTANSSKIHDNNNNDTYNNETTMGDVEIPLTGNVKNMDLYDVSYSFLYTQRSNLAPDHVALSCSLSLFP